MKINAILHVSVVVADIQKSVAFYCGVLGLERRTDRPEHDYSGAWLQVGEQEIHLLEVENVDPVTGRPAHGGRDRHTALAVSGFGGLVQRLDQAGIAYTLSRSGRQVLFCRDPDGNTLEFIAV